MFELSETNTLVLAMARLAMEDAAIAQMDTDFKELSFPFNWSSIASFVTSPTGQDLNLEADGAMQAQGVELPIVAQPTIYTVLAGSVVFDLNPGQDATALTAGGVVAGGHSLGVQSNSSVPTPAVDSYDFDSTDYKTADADQSSASLAVAA